MRLRTREVAKRRAAQTSEGAPRSLQKKRQRQSGSRSSDDDSDPEWKPDGSVGGESANSGSDSEEERRSPSSSSSAPKAGVVVAATAAARPVIWFCSEVSAITERHLPRRPRDVAIAAAFERRCGREARDILVAAGRLPPDPDRLCEEAGVNDFVVHNAVVTAAGGRGAIRRGHVFGPPPPPRPRVVAADLAASSAVPPSGQQQQQEQPQHPPAVEEDVVLRETKSKRVLEREAKRAAQVIESEREIARKICAELHPQHEQQQQPQGQSSSPATTSTTALELHDQQRRERQQRAALERAVEQAVRMERGRLAERASLRAAGPRGARPAPAKFHKRAFADPDDPHTEFLVGGRLDALGRDGEVIEVKTRIYRIPREIPLYDRVQLTCYMAVLGRDSGTLVERLRGTDVVRSTRIAFDAALWMDICRGLAEATRDIWRLEDEARFLMTGHDLAVGSSGAADRPVNNPDEPREDSPAEIQLESPS